MFVTSMSAAEKLSIKDITSGKFAAKTVNGINPIEGTDTYARISDDGKRVESYSFKTGKKIATLFDVDNTMGKKIKDFDGYILSPDGTRMLIQTETERIYRRSFRATYHIHHRFAQAGTPFGRRQAAGAGMVERRTAGGIRARQ